MEGKFRYEWEKHLAKDFPDFKVHMKEVSCDIQVEINSDLVHICDYAVRVLVDRKQCITDVDVDVFWRNCELEHSVLIKKTVCDLNIQKYVQLRKCGLTYDLITKVYRCGYKLDVTSENKCPELKISPTAKINLCDLSEKVVSTVSLIETENGFKELINGIKSCIYG